MERISRTRKPVFVTALRLCLGAAVFVSSAHAEQRTPPTAAPRIPFVVGLTTVHTVSEERGDYESLHTIVSIGKDGYRLRTSAQRPGGDAAETASALRIVAREDQGDSHRIRSWFSEIDPELFPGTVPGFSDAMLRDLAEKGETEVVYLQIESGFIKNHVRRELAGMLHRVGDGQEALRILVNGRETSLPVIQARGTLSDAEGSVTAEYTVLNDPENPLVLRASGIDSTVRVVRIEYPVPGEAADSIEQRLARREAVEIHSIYFGFNHADMRPESAPTLKKIAAILGRHPDWKLQIDGHTDDVGSDTDNLALSQQRAAAVKAMLVDRYGIAAERLVTAGYGESRPQDTNDTPEGRSHNRRVELRRL